ncbi:MAG TPA: endonuclease, partial [Methylomirabilota bacterium]|nr:endonuclease [Methylomirabilota bacterium]
MKPLIHRLTFWLTLLSFWAASLPLVAAESRSPEGTLCIMTYNLRFASATPPDAWPDRRPLMRELIRKISPDVMGTQEGLFGQVKDIAADLPG